MAKPAYLLMESSREGTPLSANLRTFGFLIQSSTTVYFAQAMHQPKLCAFEMKTVTLRPKKMNFFRPRLAQQPTKGHHRTQRVWHHILHHQGQCHLLLKALT